MILTCPTTGEACVNVGLTEEDRVMQTEVFKLCVSNDELKQCGRYVMLAQHLNTASEEGEN